ncbi:MAG: HAD family hydrolase [Candidatus Woesearchaeota archaeon]
MIRAVLLDLDNTVYPFEPAQREGLKKAFVIYKTEFSGSFEQFVKKFENAREQVSLRLNNSPSSHNRILIFKELLESNHQCYSLTLLKKIYDQYQKAFLKKIKLHPQVKDFFAFCQKRNLPIAILSDHTTLQQTDKILEAKIDTKIALLITSEEVGYDKPKKEMFEYVCQKLDVKFEECVMIGDNPVRDIEGAKKIGMKTILVQKTFAPVLGELKKLLRA